MILTFFLAYLLWIMVSWIKNYFFTSKVEKKNGFYWSTAIIAFFLLIYLCFQNFIDFYFGFFYEMMAFQQRLYGKYFILFHLYEFVTLLFLTGGLKKGIRASSSFKRTAAIAVLINVVAKFLFLPIGFNYLTFGSVIPGWHTTILPAYGIIHLFCLPFFLIIIGLLNWIYEVV